jgi:phosphotransferase system enzyme I (PtsI)
MSQYSGIGVSPGIAVGPVKKILTQKVSGEISGTLEEVLAALEAVGAELEASAESIDLEVAKEVLAAQSMMARDPSLAEVFENSLTAGEKYPDLRPVIDEAFAGFKSALTAIGGYFAERVSDLDEISHRLLSQLAGVKISKLVLTEPTVIVAQDLTPSDTASLDLKFALALVCSHGGATSHTAIVARGLGIPAIVGATGVMDVSDGTQVLVDGRTGSFTTEPSHDEISHLRTREESVRKRSESVSGPGKLRDGTGIEILGNAGTVDDVHSAIKVGAQGIGLFRTELLFLNSRTEPTVSDQVEMYSAVFAAAGGNKVVIRTLDAGSDKPVPYINAIHEENPALGVRGWRLTRTSNDVLNRQLEAISIAQKNSKTDVWVMAPMINTPAEAEDFAQRAAVLGIKHCGVMIETPAAAMHADKVLSKVQFGSFGTNDLTQYVMASDRMDSRLSDMTSAWHPAVLRTIATATQYAKALNRPMGVCGEAAAHPHLAAVLVGIGVDSLSMAPSAIGEVRGFLATVNLEQCKKAAIAAQGAESAQEAQSLAVAILGE